jgi:hypothetical protein
MTCVSHRRSDLEYDPEKWTPVSRLREALLMLPPLN